MAVKDHALDDKIVNAAWEEFMRAMRHERDIYIDFLFQYYRECTLFFCQSEGKVIIIRIILNCILEILDY